MLYLKDSQIERGYRGRELGETLGQYDQYFNVRTEQWKAMTEKIDARFVVGSDWATMTYRTATNPWTKAVSFLKWAWRQVTYWWEVRKVKKAQKKA